MKYQKEIQNKIIYFAVLIIIASFLASNNIEKVGFLIKNDGTKYLDESYGKALTDSAREILTDLEPQEPPIEIITVCGNNICEQNEFYNSCPVDCTINPIGYLNLRQGSFPRIVVQGNYAYLVKGESTRGFAVLNLNQPLNQIDIGAEISLPGAQFQNNLDVSGNYAYVVDFDTGLFIIDISNPLSPIFVNHHPLNNQFANSIKIVKYNNGAQSIAYVGHFGLENECLSVHDVTNPNNIVFLGAYACTPESNFNLAPIQQINLIPIVKYAAFSMFVYGNRLYLANGYTGLEIFGISTPTPVRIGYYDANSLVFDVFTRANNAVYISTLERGLLRLNLANPNNPQLSGQYLDNMLITRGVTGDANYIYLAGAEITNNYNMNNIWNILQTSSPTLYSILLQLSLISQEFNQVAEHHIKKEFAKSWNRPNNLLTIKNTLKILNPATLALVKEYVHSPSTPSPYFLQNPTTPFSHPQVINGQIALITDRDFGIRILNLIPPIPTLESNIFFKGEIVDSTYSGNNLFVNYGAVIDISNPYNPTLIRYFEPDLYFINRHNIHTINNALYFSSSRIKIFDLINPSNPINFGEILLGGYYPFLTDLSSNYLYILLSKPALPTTCGNNICEPPGENCQTCQQDCGSCPLLTPVIYSLSPNPIINNQNNLVIITGENFESNSVINVNGVAHPSYWVTYIDPQHMTMFVPQNTPPDQYNITVFNPSSGLESNIEILTVQSPAPPPSVCGNGIPEPGEQCGEPGLNCQPGFICNTAICQCIPPPACNINLINLIKQAGNIQINPNTFIVDSQRIIAQIQTNNNCPDGTPVNLRLIDLDNGVQQLPPFANYVVNLQNYGAQLIIPVNLFEEDNDLTPMVTEYILLAEIGNLPISIPSGIINVIHDDNVYYPNEKCPNLPTVSVNPNDGCPLPIATKFTQSVPIALNTSLTATNFTSILSLLNVSDVILNQEDNATMLFLDLVNLTRFDYVEELFRQLNLDLITIGRNITGVNPLLSPELNIAALIGLYNINIPSPVVILKDNVTCTDCEINSYINNTVLFGVPGFSVYQVTRQSSGSPPTIGGGGGSTTGTAGGGGGSGVGWPLLMIDLDTEDYYDITVPRYSRSFIVYNNENYRLRIIKLQQNKITISIFSKLYTINLNSEKEIDLDNDNIKDITIGYKEMISSVRARMTFLRINPTNIPIPPQQTSTDQGIQQTPQISQPTQELPTIQTTEILPEKPNRLLYTTAIALIIILIISMISYFVIRRRKNYSKNDNYTILFLLLFILIFLFVESRYTGLQTLPICQLTNANWNPSLITNIGQSTTFTINGNNCNGQILNIQINENSLPSTQINLQSTFSGTSATITWAPSFIYDNDITPFTNEYLSRASLSSNPLMFITSSNTLYISPELSLFMLIYNTNNPLNPTLISEKNLNIPGAINKINSIFRVSGNLAFLLRKEGLYIFDVSNPLNPTLTGSLIDYCIISPLPSNPCPYSSSTPNPIQALSNPMLRINNLLFIGSGKYDELPGVPAENIVVIDISDPSNPTKISALSNLVFTQWGNAMITDFHPLSNNLLIATDVSLGVFIIDFSDLADLKIKAQQPYTDRPDVYDAGYLYTSPTQKIFGNVRNDKIRILNLTNIETY